MLIWCGQKLTREFAQSLRQSSGSWKRVISSQGIIEVAGEYLWIQGARDLDLQDKMGILKIKDWEASLDCV